jgi:LuxR family maltose regulon positive regulatory protein
MSDQAQKPPQNRFYYSEISPLADDEPFLFRPRLNKLLDQAVQKPLVNIVAGSGYGKTLLVYSYLRNSPYLTLWFHLSDRDNNSWRFWEKYVRAVAFINPETAAKLAENGFPETKQQFDRYLLIPKRDIKPDLKYVFVYDDFHTIRNESVLYFLQNSFAATFRNTSSIVISRKEPAVNMVNLLSKGLMAQISEADLRFSQEEMIDYFRLLDITVSPEAAQNLYRDTEGWAFALYLTGLALKKGADGDYGRISMKHNVFNQIEQEIFASISGDLQKQLIKFSLVEHLPLELLVEIAGDKNIIDEMEKIGSFVQYDPYLCGYRIHTLFLEYLTSKHDRLTEEEKRKVYIQAGQWFAEHDQKMDAIAYYEKAGAYKELMALVYTFPQALPEHIARFLLDIMDRAPEELYETSPRALILHTRLLFSLNRLEEASVEVQDIIKRFEALPPSANTSWVLYGSYNNLGFIGILASPFTQNYDFSASFEKAYNHYRLSGIEIQGIITAISLGSYVCRVGITKPGEMERYSRAIASAEPHIVASMNGSACGLSDLVQAEIAYFKGDLDNTEKFAYQALYKAQKRNQYEIETRSLFYLLRLTIARGNYTKTKEFFNLLEAQLDIREYVDRSIFFDIISSWFYAHIGQTGKIVPWLLDELRKPELNFLTQGLEIQVRLKGYVAVKRYAAALVAIENEKTVYGQEAFLLGRLEMKVLEAVCLYHEKKTEAALAALEAAYELSKTNNLDMPFIEQGNTMRSLAGAALKAGSHNIPQPWLETILKNASIYAKKIFLVIQKYQEREPAEQASDRTLSFRERKVLIGLSRGQTRKEIAREAALSLNTVKMTITTLYDKLGAVNRADAIRIATAQGILKIDKP